MVSGLTSIADKLIALLAELHARSVWNVNALTASVVGSAAVSVPPIVFAFVAGEGTSQSQLGAAFASFEYLVAFAEDFIAVSVGNHDEAWARLGADDVLCICWMRLSVAVSSFLA